MIEKLEQHYGYLFEDDLIKEIADVAIYKEFKANSTIIDIDSYLVSIPLIISGAIKVLREDKEGDDLVLYYIEITTLEVCRSFAICRCVTFKTSSPITIALSFRYLCRRSFIFKKAIESTASINSLSRE